MGDVVSNLTEELWGLLVNDGGIRVSELKEIRKRDNRRGRLKRMLVNAIDRSTLGNFNHMVYYFGGKVYEPVDIKVCQKVIWDIMANRIDLPDADLNHMADIYSDCMNAIYSKPLRISNDIMLFRNGVLDIAHDKFYRQFDKRFVSLYAVDYDYEPGASTFLWYTFLNQVLPDKKLQEVLQMFLGSTFIDRAKVKIESIMILLGKGANGKSVVHDAVCGVIGKDYVGEMGVGRLCSASREGDLAVAEINGKRLNYCTEMETTDFYKKSARLKAIISGENVTARQLWGSPYKATNIPLLMANANEIPIFNKKDGALVRRIYIIPFNVQIPPERQNKTLGDELVDEYPGILNWILEGRKKFIANGYSLPPDVNLARYIRESRIGVSTVLKYMIGINGWLPRLDNDDVTIAPVNWKGSTELYNGYVRWCKQNEIASVSRPLFNRELENEGYVRKRFGEGYKFAIYGDITFNTLSRRTRDVNTSVPIKRQLWIDGVLYVFSMKDLSDYSGVSTSTISNLNREGMFDNMKKWFREKTVYDVKACCAAMRERFIIATDDEKDIVQRIGRELKYMRYVFNQWAAYNKFPYRKYGHEEQLEDWVEVVPDETTYQECIDMARKAGLDVSKALRYKNTPGIFGKGGKGFFESVDDIPTEEERKMLEEPQEIDLNI